MSMVDPEDPFKGLETTRQTRKRTHKTRWIINNILFVTMVILTVIAGVNARYDEMRFGVLVLFFMLVVDYLHDIRREVRALQRLANKGDKRNDHT